MSVESASQSAEENSRAAWSARSNRACTYDNSTRKRGLQTGYVRNLEIVLGVLFRQFPRSEEQMQAVLRSHYGEDNPLERDAPELLETWRRSNLARDMEKLLESSGRVTAMVERQGSVITRSPIEELELEMVAPHNNGSEAESSHNAPTNAQARKDQGGPRSTPSTQTHSPEDFLYYEDLPESSPDLVEFYLNHVHGWFPIIKRSDILKALHTKLVKDENPNHRDAGLRTCLWAILAYGLSNPHFADIDCCPQRIQAVIRNIVISIDSSFELGHIQAILILVLLRIARGDFHVAWILVAQATRMIVIYGDRRSESADRYHHTLCGCVLLDNIISALLNKKPCLSSRDIAFTEGDLNDDSLDEWQMWDHPVLVPGSGRTRAIQKQPLRALSTFHRMSELAQQLNRSVSGPQDTKSVQDVVQYLESWRSNLPPHLDLSGTTLSGLPVLHLHLMWHLVICTLLKNSNTMELYLRNLAVQSTNSIQELVRQYINSMGPEACSPLLSCYVTQAHQCLQNFVSQIDGVAVIREQQNELSEIVKTLTRQWQSKDQNLTQDTVLNGPENQLRSMNQVNVDEIDDSGNRAAALQQKQQRRHLAGRLDMSTPLEEVAPQVAQTRKEPHEGNVENVGERATNLENDDIFGDAGTSWDACFEGMISLIPARRLEQVPLFSQNLGFLTDNLDADWIDFLQDTGAPG